jgi:hypothetical protein
MNQLGLKDLSRKLQKNCIISYLFYLYLILYAYVVKFDVIENLKKLQNFLELNKANFLLKGTRRLLQCIFIV